MRIDYCSHPFKVLMVCRWCKREDLYIFPDGSIYPFCQCDGCNKFTTIPDKNIELVTKEEAIKLIKGE